jgi:hypothetical protein
MAHSAKKLNVSTSCEQQVDLIKTEKLSGHNILTYDVLRIIFQYLSAKDLFKVASICRQV